MEPQPHKARLVPLIGMFYCSLIILCNFTASKIATVAGFDITVAILFFPVTYILDDILTEVYGFKVSRTIIWSGLLCNLMVSLGGLIAVSVPASEHWEHQGAFKTVFEASPRILLASASAYFLGEFSNSIILAKMKVATKGRFFALRAITSSVIGLLFDTLCFTFVAFFEVLPVDVIWSIIYVEYSIKIGYEVIALPFTYYVTNAIKKFEGIDHFDYHTKFNPFGFTL